MLQALKYQFPFEFCVWWKKVIFIQNINTGDDIYVLVSIFKDSGAYISLNISLDILNIYVLLVPIFNHGDDIYHMARMKTCMAKCNILMSTLRIRHSLGNICNH